MLLLLHEKVSLSYTELMNGLAIDSTGKMNYHLKILNELVVKREDGNYALTEKGMLASRLLTDFPEANRQQFGLKPKWWRRFWLGAMVSFISFFVIYFAAYSAGYINSSNLYENLVSLILIMGFCYMIQHILRDVLSKNAQLVIAKMVYIAIGVFLGITIAFIAGGFAFVGISRLLGKQFEPGDPLYAFFWSDGYLIFSLLIAPTVGAIASYNFGKKRHFRTQNYNPDL